MENLPSSWYPHGLALKSYWQGNKKAEIGIKMNDGSITKMPISIYFRTIHELPEIEKIALDYCRGKVLDVGAGAGSHSLILQQKQLDVTAIDLSPEGVEIMGKLGVEFPICVDFLNFNSDVKFDTLLFLMNGIGLAGTLVGLEKYLQKAHELTHPKSHLILDSSDLRNGEIELDFSADYFGEIEYQLIFKKTIGEKYKWLYIEQELLSSIAAKNNWYCEIIYEQEDGSYLAKLTKK